MKPSLIVSRAFVTALTVTLFVATQGGCTLSTTRIPTNVGMQIVRSNSYAGGLYREYELGYSGSDAFAPSVSTCVDTYTGGARVDIDRRTMIVSTCQNLIRQNIPAPQWGMYMGNWGWNGGYGQQFYIPGRFTSGVPFVSYKLTNLTNNKNGH